MGGGGSSFVKSEVDPVPVVDGGGAREPRVEAMGEASP